MESRPQRLREVLSTLGRVCTIAARAFGVLGPARTAIWTSPCRALEIAHRRAAARDFDVSVDPFHDAARGVPPPRFYDKRHAAGCAERRDSWIITAGERILPRGLIRRVNAETFVEDALRAFRGAQFAARLSAVIEPGTRALCAGMDVRALSQERVFAEMEQGAAEGEQAVRLLPRSCRSMDHLKEFFPERRSHASRVPQNPKFHPEGDVFEHTMLTLDCAAALRERAEWPLGLMLSALVHDHRQVRGDAGAGRRQDYCLWPRKCWGLKWSERQLRRLTNHEKLIRYALNMTELHMRPNMLCGSNSKKKKTRAAVRPEPVARTT